MAIRTPTVTERSISADDALDSLWWKPFGSKVNIPGSKINIQEKKNTVGIATKTKLKNASRKWEAFVDKDDAHSRTHKNQQRSRYE